MLRLLTLICVFGFSSVFADEVLIDEQQRRDEYQADVQQWFERLKKEPRAIDIAPLNEIPGDIRGDVCLKLIRNHTRVAEALVTLQRYSYRSDYEFDTEFEDICKALGPHLRLAATKDLLGTVEGSLPLHFPRFMKVLEQFHELPQSSETQLILLSTHSDWIHVETAFHLMAKLPSAGPQVLTCLKQGLQHVDHPVRIAALQAAEKLMTVDLLEECRPLLLDANTDVAITAAGTMLILDENEMAPIHVLNDMFVESSSDSLRKNIAEALKHSGPRAAAACDALLIGLQAKPELQDGGFFQFDTGLNTYIGRGLPNAGPTLLPQIGTWLRSSQVGLRARTRILGYLQVCEFPIDSLSMELYQQLDSPKEEVVEAALIALGKCKELDARKLQNLTDRSVETRRALASVLKKSSPDSRTSAAGMLLSLMSELNTSVAIAACESHWQLFQQQEQIIPYLKRILASPVEWHTGRNWPERDSRNLLNQITNPPEVLIEQLVEKATSGSESEKYVAVDRLGCFGAAAVSALLKCVTDKDSQIRSAAVGELAGTGDARAVNAIASLLEDQEHFSYAISNHFYGSTTVSQAAIAALANPKLDASSVLPQLIQLSSDRNLGANAVVAIRNIGLPARSALPKLRSLQTPEANQHACEVLRTLAVLEPSRSDQLAAMSRLIDLAETAGLKQLWTTFDFDLTLTELADKGQRYPELDSRLRELVLANEFLVEEYRVQAAYVLATFFPEETRWRKYIQDRDDGVLGNLMANHRWQRLTTGVGVEGEH